MVVWAFMFCVTTDAYRRIFNKIWLTMYFCTELSYLSFFFCILARGAHDPKLASEKPLLALGDGF